MLILRSKNLSKEQQVTDKLQEFITANNEEKELHFHEHIEANFEIWKG